MKTSTGHMKIAKKKKKKIGKSLKLKVILLFLAKLIQIFGSSALNPGAVFLRFFTVAFLLFLTPAGLTF